MITKMEGKGREGYMKKVFFIKKRGTIIEEMVIYNSDKVWDAVELNQMALNGWALTSRKEIADIYRKIRRERYA